MKTILYSFFFLGLLTSTLSFSQNTDNQYLYDIIDKEMDSISTLKLQQQNQNTISENVMLLDSTYRHIIGDVGECEDFIKYYYEYDSFGRVSDFIYKYAENENCEPYRRKRSYTYNGSNLIEEILYKYNASIDNWVYFIKDEYIYNENDLLIEEKEFIWNVFSIEWEANKEITYNHDNNNLLEQIHFRWDEDIDDWEAYYKQLYVYNINEDIIEYEKYYKSQSEQQYEWTDITKNIYTYDSNNFLIGDLKSYNWNNTTMNWDSILNKTYINDVNGNRIEELLEIWDATLEDWVNYRVFTKTYNENNNVLESIRLDWNEDSWLNKTKTTYNYTPIFRLSFSLKQNWNTINEVWENDWKENRSYNEYDKIIERIQEIWINESWIVETTYTYEYDSNQILVYQSSYSMFTGEYSNHYYSEHDISLNISENEFQNSITIVPNPTNGVFSIKGLHETAQLLLFDVSGKMLLNSRFNEIIDITTLQKGVYLVKIISGDSIAIKKLIKN